ncbi:hypothetical protein [Pedobacter sp. WC2423]|uniref:hypothetical protein n=1 Tax=Pedobacter sp. WC2423 TaxID=3234142 RepID=UPI003466B228
MKNNQTTVKEQSEVPKPFTDPVWSSLSDTERSYIRHLIDYYESKSSDSTKLNIEQLQEFERPLHIEKHIELTEELLVKIGKAIQNLKI